MSTTFAPAAAVLRGATFSALVAIKSAGVQSNMWQSAASTGAPGRGGYG
ncbi:hypothetical protein IRT45_01925 [Nocardia sp. BSTN01]|nr:hypothetical protein [Nocardia sp. BSTN01]MBF4995908.1 hypothetical protein [Nocardia sp. BSTN01]